MRKFQLNINAAKEQILALAKIAVHVEYDDAQNIVRVYW